MRKKTLRLLCTAADRQRAEPILEALRRKGFRVLENAVAPKKREAVLLVLSAAFAADGEAQERFFAADSAGSAIIPVELDGAAQPDLVRSALIAKNAIEAQGRTAEEIAERIASAEVFQSGPSHLPRILLAAALILVLGAGVWIWQGSAAATERRAAVQSAAGYGLRAEDLEKIASLAVIGDRVVYSTSGYVTNSDAFVTNSDVLSNGELFRLADYAYQTWDDRTWRSTENGEEIALTHYDDLGFLRYLPNLRSLTLLRVECDALPSLASLGALEQVTLESCVLPDYAWLSGAQMFNLICSGCNVSDFSPLSGCEKLMGARFELYGLREADFSAFSPPMLSGVSLCGWEGLETIELSGLQRCELHALDLEELPLSELSCLAGQKALNDLSLTALRELRDLTALGETKYLYSLNLLQLDALRDISSVGGLKGLTVLSIERCERIEDYSAVGGCERLYSFSTYGCNNLRDASFLGGLDNLTRISLDDCPLRDLNFLRRLGEGNADGRDLKLSGEIRDYSGLAAVKNYNQLSIEPRGEGRYADAGVFLPYLAGATVKNLMLGHCGNLDLAALPRVTQSLCIYDSDLRDLSGLGELTLRSLRLESLEELSSLSGLESVSAPKDIVGITLEIINCPRLNDWEALGSVSVNRLDLEQLYTLPDFAAVVPRHLTLRAIAELGDLRALDALGEGTRLQELRLIGLSGLYDLSPLRRLKIDSLEIPPQLAEQAQELCESGNVSRYSVVITGDDWGGYEGEIRLNSLSELETLPKALLRQVTRLCLAGDTVADTERYEVLIRPDEESGTDRLLLRERASGEESEPEGGTLGDLSALSALTGLRELELWGQGIESLEGVETMDELESLRIRGCGALCDATAAFTVQSLRWLELPDCALGSIRGVQNLTELEEIDLCGTAVTDLTPLLELPRLRRVTVSSDMNEAIESIQGEALPFELEIR